MLDKVYQELAKLVSWNPMSDEFVSERNRRIQSIMESAPCGSGSDIEVNLLEDKSNKSELVFQVNYRCVNKSFVYCEWLTAIVTVIGNLLKEGIDINVDFGNNIKAINEAKRVVCEQAVRRTNPQVSESVLKEIVDERADYLSEDAIKGYIEYTLNFWLNKEYVR